MPDPTTRALIRRLADELDHYRQLLTDDRREVHALATEARAALAAEPQGPTKAEIHALANELLDGDRASRVDFARAVLTRWGRLAAQPGKRKPIPNEGTVLALALQHTPIREQPQGEGLQRPPLDYITPSTRSITFPDPGSSRTPTNPFTGKPVESNPKPPAEGEVAEVVARLLDFSTDLLLQERSRAADLLEHALPLPTASEND